MTTEAGAAALTFALPDEAPPFPHPLITADTEFFFRSGADGVLRLLRCGGCSYYVHPPSPRCPRCGSGEVAPTPVSGRGTVYSYSIAVQQFVPGLAPYCIGMIQVEEQEDVRLVGQLVGCTSETVAIGLPVQVEFLHQTDDVWIPCFRVVES
jgi:uncharacterized OB-fold protein